MHGQGTWTHPSGDKYVGEWREGKRSGQGTYTYADGRKYVGQYKENKEWNGVEYDKGGKVTATYSEGLKHTE